MVCNIVAVYAALEGAVYGTFTMVAVMSWYTPPLMLMKLNTFVMLLLIPSDKADSWLSVYSLKVLLFYRPIFWISLLE